VASAAEPASEAASEPATGTAAADATLDASPDATPDGAGVPTAGLVHGIRLAPGVLLLLDGTARGPGPQDLAPIVDAARPLLRELASRGLDASGLTTDPR
jgi:hypothetical protein